MQGAYLTIVSLGRSHIFKPLACAHRTTCVDSIYRLQQIRWDTILAHNEISTTHVHMVRPSVSLKSLVTIIFTIRWYPNSWAATTPSDGSRPPISNAVFEIWFSAQQRKEPSSSPSLAFSLAPAPTICLVQRLGAASCSCGSPEMWSRTTTKVGCLSLQQNIASGSSHQGWMPGRETWTITDNWTRMDSSVPIGWCAVRWRLS